MAPRIYRYLAIAYILLVLVFLLVPIQDPQSFRPLGIKNLDKVVHLGIFAILYILLTKASLDKELLNAVQKIMIFCFGFALLTECLQGLTTYRSFEWNDVAADLAGIAVGYAVTRLFNRFFVVDKKRRQNLLLK